MTLRVAILLFAVHLAATTVSAAAPPIGLSEPVAPAFEPGQGAALDIPVRLSVPGEVVLDIRSGDGDLVRRYPPRALAPGDHVLQWDGRDDQGTLVPDEAYHLVLECRCGGTAPVVLDPRDTTGGHLLEGVKPILSPDGSVAFDVPVPSRLLVRVGMKGGAMMRALENWRPRAAGRATLAWDGRDASGVTRLLGQEGLTVLVSGYTLPDQTVITRGNRRLDYAAYRQARGWGQPTVRMQDLRLERDGKRLARQSRLPLSLLRDPRTSLVVVGAGKRDVDGAFRIDGPTDFKVDVAAQDKWPLEQSLYEVSFFLDQEFVSEEETGYTPLTWRWDPAGLAPGLHVMTVNVSGYWGHVGVASVLLRIGDKTAGSAP